MNRQFNFQRTVSSVLLALLAASAEARAADARMLDVPRRTVSYADLNLSQADGVAKLYARIGFAARQVCQYQDSASLHQAKLTQECTRDSIARAVRDVGVPALTQYHVSRTSQRILLAAHH
jgi:UrcA family protein